MRLPTIKVTGYRLQGIGNRAQAEKKTQVFSAAVRAAGAAPASAAEAGGWDGESGEYRPHFRLVAGAPREVERPVPDRLIGYRPAVEQVFECLDLTLVHGMDDGRPVVHARSLVDIGAGRQQPIDLDQIAGARGRGKR